MMATEDKILPWGLHELEGGRRVGNDAGNKENQKNLDDLSQGKPEEDGGSDSAPKLTSTANEPVQDPYPDPTSVSTYLPDATNELLVHHLYLPPRFCHTANDALIAQALQEEFHRLEAAEDLCVKQQVPVFFNCHRLICGLQGEKFFESIEFGALRRKFCVEFYGL
jgi:hypothetical protein